jgi:hypothetical protein
MVGGKFMRGAVITDIFYMMMMMFNQIELQYYPYGKCELGIYIYGIIYIDLNVFAYLTIYLYI